MATISKRGGMLGLVVLMFGILGLWEASLWLSMGQDTAFDDEVFRNASTQAKKALAASSISSTNLLPRISTPLQQQHQVEEELSHAKQIRRPLVYVYDWLAQCYEIGLCRTPTLEASREKLCKSYRDAVVASNGSKSFTEILAACSSLGGFGDRLDGLSSTTVSVHETHQFASGSLFETRLLKSKWRTLNASQASLFFVPYDFYIDGFELLYDYNAAKKDWLKSKVLRSPWFLRHSGSDHFAIDSAARFFASARAGFLDGDQMANVTKLSIENLVYSRREYDRYGRSTHVSSKTFLASRWASVPYPSFFHPTPKAPSNWHPCFPAPGPKTNLVAMVFSNDTASWSTNQVRQRLLNSCRAHPSLCETISLSHKVLHNVFAPTEEIVKLYQRSKFCLVPPGDTYTSKRFFDAIGACCFPIIVSPVDLTIWRKVYGFAFEASLVPWLNSLPRKLNLTEAVAHLQRQDEMVSFEERRIKVKASQTSKLFYFADDHPAVFDAVDAIVDRLLEIVENEKP